MNKCKILYSFLLLSLFLMITNHTQAQYPSQQTQETPDTEYTESAIRRFEIVTLSALPFTAVHSYLGVRGLQMIQQNKIAPVLTPKNYRIMGISAVSLSLFIGVWDWLHTRDVDRSAPSIPGRTPPSQEDDEIPDDGTIASATYYGLYSRNIYWDIHSQNEIDSMKPICTKLNNWMNEQPTLISLTLLEMRF
ncbi:hypothetical protein JT359_04390 [Candidatus Poribacteria bacterium]|nr:hypothetical protein [Candidatus Poribacteria bacterium]